jgi:hypothetical protein
MHTCLTKVTSPKYCDSATPQGILTLNPSMIIFAIQGLGVCLVTARISILGLGPGNMETEEQSGNFFYFLLNVISNRHYDFCGFMVLSLYTVDRLIL